MESQDLHSIREALAKLYPDENPDRAITAATNNFVALSRTPHDALLGWALASTQDLHRRMLETGDFAGALAAVKQVAALAKQMDHAKRKNDEVEIDL